jgi:hypothetical protein
MFIQQQVENNARSSLFLRALSKVLEKSIHPCGSSSCVDLLYSAAYRLGWQATFLVAVVLMLAPNLIFLLIRNIGHRRIARLERFMCESNDEKAATYENAFMASSTQVAHHHHQQQQQRIPQSSVAQRIFCSPSRNYRKTAYFYQPLEFYDDEYSFNTMQRGGSNGGHYGNISSCSTAATTTTATTDALCTASSDQPLRNRKQVRADVKSC